MTRLLTFHEIDGRIGNSILRDTVPIKLEGFGDVTDIKVNGQEIVLIGDKSTSKPYEPSSLAKIQFELKSWQKHNFPNRDNWEPAMGIAEESGELCHAVLKRHQGIRGTPEEHKAAIKDAVADIIIYCADLANAEGFSLEATVSEVWLKVKQRDWALEREKRAANK